MNEDIDWKHRASVAEEQIKIKDDLFNRLIKSFEEYKTTCAQIAQERSKEIEIQCFLLCEKSKEISELEEEHAIRDKIATEREALILQKDKEILELHEELKEAKDDYWKAFNLSNNTPRI